MPRVGFCAACRAEPPWERRQRYETDPAGIYPPTPAPSAFGRRGTTRGFLCAQARAVLRLTVFRPTA